MENTGEFGGGRGRGDARFADDDAGVDRETDEIIDGAFPTAGDEVSPDLSHGRVFAVIPEEAIEAGPEYFASTLRACRQIAAAPAS